MISPKHFEEFVLFELSETAKLLDHTIYYLDGQEQIRYLNMLLSIKEIDNIQWAPVARQPNTSFFTPKNPKGRQGIGVIPELDELPFLMEN
ncbi:MAG: hypothetical protein RR444_07940 [Oscillospiraceae bacterium]